MTKKALVLIAGLLIIGFVWAVNSKPQLSFFSSDRYAYLGSNSSSADIVKTNNFCLYFNRTGESVELAYKVDVDKIFNGLQAKLVFSEQTDDGVSYYAYSPVLKFQTLLSGKRVNLHVFVGENRSVIGSPLIFGSF